MSDNLLGKQRDLASGFGEENVVVRENVSEADDNEGYGCSDAVKVMSDGELEDTLLNELKYDVVSLDSKRETMTETKNKGDTKETENECDTTILKHLIVVRGTWLIFILNNKTVTTY